MLKFLNSIARDLLGLHGHPIAPFASSAPTPPVRREPASPGCIGACARRAQKAFAVAKGAFGPSAMGHVFW
ncbi:hypothetical protein [Dokdonella sp.]|uniref:hypothetical protein n=1 Tax=Dokdonella sp. TaxID=2291710 RepID=UPI001B000EEC|nr:hypothetical protein [Dokdonella sp.]MBO9662030.1 hypothetical protein [Dokdonella sp.]